jgi:ketosteroid isomerase-like protein
MSQENVEVARRVVAAWNSDNLEGFLTELDPEIEWHAALEQALEGAGSTYRGHEGARRAWDVYRSEAFGGLTVHVQEFRDLGEWVLCLGRMDATGRTTGIEVGGELGLLFSFRNGKLARSRDFLSHAEALEAAGLSE